MANSTSRVIGITINIKRSMNKHLEKDKLIDLKCLESSLLDTGGYGFFMGKYFMNFHTLIPNRFMN